MCCVLDRARLWPAAEARWADADYLRRNLTNVPCNVLAAPADGRRFSYWFDPTDRVQAGYQATPLVSTRTMSIDDYLWASRAEPSSDDGSGAAARCLYLQHNILQADPRGGAGLVPCSGLGEEMARDVAHGIDLANVQAIAQAGGFGPWQRSQLFIGGAAVAGARSILHFDQYDNLFVQLSGTKHFRIYDPQQTGNLYAYPVHHPLDTRSQVDLAEQDYGAFPRLRDAAFVELTLRPGQCLFLPAYWWHEVRTEPAARGELTVSVNFWFAATTKLLRPTIPLAPSMVTELSRQLEYLITDCLDDRARLVPAFFGALLGALRAGGADPNVPPGCDLSEIASAAREAMHIARPPEVRSQTWEGLFEFVVWKLALLIGPAQMWPFVRDMCHPCRFEQLRLRGASRTVV